MDCRKIESLISPYLDGELTRTEAAEVKAHLALCARCSQEYELMMEMSSALQQIKEITVPAPAGFSASLMERINNEDRVTQQPVRQRWVFDHWRQAFAGAAAAVMLALGALSVNPGPIIQIAENPPAVTQADNGISITSNPEANNNGNTANGTNTNGNQNGEPGSGSNIVSQNSGSNSSPLVLLNKERNLTTTLLQIKTTDSSALEQTMNYAAKVSAQVQNLGQQANENGSFTVLQLTVSKTAASSLISSLVSLGDVTSKEVTSNEITTQFADKLSQYQALVAQRSAIQDENQAVSLDQQIKGLENELKDWDLKAEQETIILWLQK